MPAKAGIQGLKFARLRPSPEWRCVNESPLPLRLFDLISTSFVMLMMAVMIMHLAFFHRHFHVHYFNRRFNFSSLTEI